MLTISIADSLQGPAAWSEWGSADAEAVAAAEAWQHQLAASPWGLDAQHTEGLLAASQLSLDDLQEAWKQASEDPALWNPWAADASLQHWGLNGLEPSEAAASLALVAAAMTSSAVAGKVAPANEAAWASPLRVPLPEPLALEPLSELELGPEIELLELPVDNVYAEPQKVSAPPGLKAHGGPGALLADAARAVTSVLSQQPMAPGLVPPGIMDHAPPGMTISPGEVEGRSCSRVCWKIDDFSGKLQASMGRPVVSPAFAACGLSNLRLMVFPDARDAVKSARSHERKGLYTAMVKKGPLYGSLKLKADGLEKATVMNFSFTVGNVRAGPTEYDFSEQAVLGMDDFGVDWLQQVDKSSGALHVSVEIFEVRQK